MEFDDIKARIRNTGPDTTRTDSDDYFEAVIDQARIEEVARVLESIFGAPAWPSDKKLSKDTQILIKSVGGLRGGQTLYVLSNGGGCSAFAMLWPWQNGEKVTLKISKI